METKECNCCGQPRPIKSFQWCCDGMTGQKKWRRNICNRCIYERRLQKRLPQLASAMGRHML